MIDHDFVDDDRIGLRFGDERYVRVYTRETLAQANRRWEARCTLNELFKRVDRAGLLSLAGSRNHAQSIATLIRYPVEVVESGLQALVEDGTITITGDPNRQVLFIPNFLEAQECATSDAARQRAHRENVAAKQRAARLGMIQLSFDLPAAKSGTRMKTAVPDIQRPAIPDLPVTNRDEMSRPVTAGNEPSQIVTPSRAVPTRTCPSRSEAPRARMRTREECIDPIALRILEELESRTVLLPAGDLVTLAERLAGQAATGGKRVEWVITTIDEVALAATAAEIAGSPWSPTHLATQVLKFASRARRPELPVVPIRGPGPARQATAPNQANWFKEKACRG